MGKIEDIDLTVLTVEGWEMNGKYREADALQVESPYHFIIGKTFWSGKENRGFYVSGLLRAFNIAQPEVIYLMEEPFSLFAIQVLSLAAILFPNTPVVFFTWTNLSLRQFDYRPSVWYSNVSRWVLPRLQYGLTANSDAIKVLTEENFSAPTKMVGYGVDTDSFRSVSESTKRSLREKLDIPNEATIVGFIGRMMWMKGLDLLLDSFAKLKRNTDKPLILLLVGSGTDEPEILSRANDLGLSSSIRHITSVPQTEVPPYIALMDILVLPSRRVRMWAEQFGRVLVEAMAARTLVIGSSSGAIPEVIGNAGFVFEENNANDLFRVLSQVVNLSEDEKNRMLIIGEERAANQYSWKKFAEESSEAIRYVYNNRFA
ncbi:MAG TPA: glycosyltransferase family 4 protein [Candidatus Kapabacteria bacterium]